MPYEVDVTKTQKKWGKNITIRHTEMFERINFHIFMHLKLFCPKKTIEKLYYIFFPSDKDNLDSEISSDLLSTLDICIITEFTMTM